MALTTPEALDFHARLGGPQLMARNAALAREAGATLARAWRTEMTGPADHFAAMVTVRLPLTGAVDGARAESLMRELGTRHRIAAPVVVLEGAAWVRISAQAYNAIGDYERLATVFNPSS